MYRTRKMTRDEALYLIHKRFGVALLKQDRAKMFADLRSMGFAIMPVVPTELVLAAGSLAIAEVLDQSMAPTPHFRREALASHKTMIAAYEKEVGDAS